MELNKNNKNTISIFYDITLSCNNRCSYCYQLQNLNNSLVFNLEVFETFKYQFNNIDKLNKVELHILGGDPLFIDDIIKLNELDLTNTDLVIFSNCNYEPSKFKNKIERLNDIKFKIYVSFHESSNTEYVIQNILYLISVDKLDMVSFMINLKNLETLKPIVEEIKSLNVNFGISPIRIGKSAAISQEILNFLDIHQNNNNTITIDNIILNDKEIRNLKIENISYNFFTKCRLSIFRVDFFGNISSACEYNLNSNIKNGFLVKDVLCNNKTCYCDTSSYKVLLKSKNTKESESILNFIKENKS